MALPASLLVIVGDEILAGFTVDRNGPLAARRLFEAGYPVARIEIVGDAVADIATAVRRGVADPAVARIIVCGGVGPTPDDRTHEGVAAGLDRALVENVTALASIEAQVARMHRAGWLDSPIPSAANRRMALMAEDGRALENRRGMAPPLAVALGADRWLFVLPGVPWEFESALEEAVIPEFFTGGRPLHVVELRCTGVAEAEIAGPMLQLGREFPDVAVGSYPQRGRELIVRLRGEDPIRVRAGAARLVELRPGRWADTGSRDRGTVSGRPQEPPAHRSGAQP
jgi:molybdopterin-biosynthesis enzyme MoeA-like protein